MTRRGDQAKLYTAQWNDDIHHVLHVAATHEINGYYAAYGSTDLLGKTIAEGFAYQGEMMPYRNAPRGGPSAELPPDAFVSFIQTTTRSAIGRLANGSTRWLPEVIGRLPASTCWLLRYRCYSLGEEWGATSPFLFCDCLESSEAVRKDGARNSHAFPSCRPGAGGEDSRSVRPVDVPRLKLDWTRVDATHLAYYRELLKIRRECAAVAAFHSTWGRGARGG